MLFLCRNGVEIWKSEAGRSFYKGHSLRLSTPLGQFRQHNRLTAISQTQSLAPLRRMDMCLQGEVTKAPPAQVTVFRRQNTDSHGRGQGKSALGLGTPARGEQTVPTRVRAGGGASDGGRRPRRPASQQREGGHRTSRLGDGRAPGVTLGMQTSVAVTWTQHSEQPRVGTASTRRNAVNRENHHALTELGPQSERAEKSHLRSRCPTRFQACHILETRTRDCHAGGGDGVMTVTAPGVRDDGQAPPHRGGSDKSARVIELHRTHTCTHDSTYGGDTRIVIQSHVSTGQSRGRTRRTCPRWEDDPAPRQQASHTLLGRGS